MFFRFFYCLILLLCLCGAQRMKEQDKILDNQSFDVETEDPIFVSLGSTCEVAHHLRELGLRKAAFPFDWIKSIDNFGFIMLLKDDFRYFLDEKYLEPYSNGTLLNTFYKLAYPHEGKWKDLSDLENNEALEAFKSKYKRRINRFRSLGNYKGKVYFLRAAYPNAEFTEYYQDKGNMWIYDDWTFLLYEVLKTQFPKLNFHLVIINLHKEEKSMKLRKLNSNITVVECNLYQGGNKNKIDNCKKLYSQLLVNQE